MKKVFKILLLFVFVGLANSSCKKDEPIEYIDPTLAFWGKWDLIYTEMGSVSSSFYFQFFQDSTMRIQYYSDPLTDKFEYWVDTILHISLPPGGEEHIVFEFQYKFFGNDTLDLQQVNPFVYGSFGFKRTE